MELSGAEPLSRLRSLVSKVLGTPDSAADDNEATHRAASGEASRDEGTAGQNWLSHFATIAPDHIKRWTNPLDGTGNIPYEQLVENLQQFNIPARHVSQYTVGQLLGVEPPPQEKPAAEEEATCATPSAPTYTPRPHKLGPQAAAYLGTKQDPGFTQVIPVRAVTKAFVGPVREKVGAISGEACKLLKRPGEASEVPPDYIEVVGSKHVSPIGCDINVSSRQSSEVSGLDGAVGPATPERTCHKPPPIYLEPTLDPRRGASNKLQGLGTTPGSNAAAEYVANIPKCLPGKVDLGNVHTKEDKEVYDALNKPVVYTMGTYIWSKEQAQKGDAHPVEPPPIDACFGKLCRDMFSPKAPSEASQEPTKEEPATERTALGIAEILEMCKKYRDKLAAFADSVVETREDPAVGGQGLFATAEVKKGQVVFVETPLFTCDIESDSMWTTFIGLTDDQRAAVETLQGFHSDLSEAESLWCILIARANKRIELAKQFKSFFAKMKRNAHGLPSQAGWGLYPKAAMVNHSCEPNVTYRNLDGLLVYFATRDISPGEIISMTYIDQLYASASFRNKRLLQTKCFTCKCTRCNSMDGKERRMLCPSCRPIKLKIVDPAAGVPAVPPAIGLTDDKRSDADSDQEPKSKTTGSDSHLEACPTEGGETSAQASDDDSKGPLQSSDDEAEPSVDTSSELPLDDEGSSATPDGGLASSDSTKLAGSDDGEGSMASDEENHGCADLSDSASSDARSQEGLSGCGKRKVLKCSLTAKKNAECGSLVLSMYSMETSASRSRDWGATSSDDESVLCGSGATSMDSIIVDGPQKLQAAPPRMYCQRGADGVWVCHTCSGRFTDNDMPIGMEDYFERLYVDLQSKFNWPSTPQWTVDVGSLIKSIEAVLGTQHWLYAACNLLLAQLYLGQWVGGMVRDCIFDRSLKHAEVFMEFVETTTREALHVDCAPLAASLMRVLLFNGRWSTFEEWVDKGRLEIVKDCFGPWDEAFLSFSQAHEYLRSCRSQGELPQLSVLHRYAHTAQHSVVQAAERLEEREAARRKALKDAAREREQERQVQQERLRSLHERNRRLRERVDRLKAEAAAQAKIKDVTSSHADGVLAKFMLAGVDDCVINDAAMAVQRAHQYAKEMQEAAVQGRQLYPGNMAADMAYLPPHGVMPSAYLPLIMLDDPLRAIPEKSRQARQRRAAAAREKALLEALSAQQDLDFEEDESVDEELAKQTEGDSGSNELTMIYRIPGLPGTAPGEFVNVSQLVHDEKGNHAPLPLFKSFFYIDAAERKRNLKPEEQNNLIVLGSSSSPPALQKEKLEDIEAAKYNYLHEERQLFEKDVKAGVLLAAAEAGALEDETKLVDVVDATNKVIRRMAVQEARAERALEAARYAFKGMEPPDRTSIGTTSLITPSQDPSLDAKPVAHTTAGVGKDERPQEPTPSLRASVTMPAVWEYVPSQDCEKGPTVFLYPPSSQPAPAAAKDCSGSQSECEESNGAYMRKRIVKPLDFSHVPPPPSVEALVGSLGNTHQHYKMSRMNMMLKRYASASKVTNDA